MGLLAFPDNRSEHGRLLGIAVLKDSQDGSAQLYEFWEKVFFDGWYEDDKDAMIVGEEQFGIREWDWIDVPEFEDRFFTSEKTDEDREEKNNRIREWLVQLVSSPI